MFGDRLKILREEKELTQEEIANHIGITKQAFSKYELNLRQPDYGTLIKLADFFNVSIDYLLCRTKIRLMQNCNKSSRDNELSIKYPTKNITETIDIFLKLIENNINNKKIDLLKDYLKMFEQML
jgi:transcriptional regulator with XRE-family HTH domain